jgi:hypothetical protein
VPHFKSRTAIVGCVSTSCWELQEQQLLACACAKDASSTDTAAAITANSFSGRCLNDMLVAGWTQGQQVIESSQPTERVLFGKHRRHKQDLITGRV